MKKNIFNKFPFLFPSVQLHAKYDMLTTEMYQKYKEEEEISPRKYGEV